MTQVKGESIRVQSEVAPLDPSLLKNLTSDDFAFLRDVISKDESKVRERLLQVQELSYKVFAYPCIAYFHFATLGMRQNAVYPQLIEAGKKGNTIFLEIGCLMGSDLRKLVHDGYPASNVVGSDLRHEFIDIGLDNLYQDRTTCAIHFFAADVLELPAPTTAPVPPSTTPLRDITELKQLRNRVTHLYMGLLFHLFTKETQRELALRAASLLKREKGAVIFGRHEGRPEAGDIQDDFVGYHDERYAHSPESWTQLWRDVFTEIEGAAFVERVVVNVELKIRSQTDVDLLRPKAKVRGLLSWSVIIV